MSEILSNFKFELFGRVASALAGAVLTVLLARLLTSEEYGLLFLTLSIIGIVKIFSRLGIAKSGARYISHYKSQSPSQIRHIIKTTFAYNIISIIISVLALLLIIPYLVNIFDEDPLIPLLYWSTLFLIFATIVNFSRNILQGFEDIKSASLIHGFDGVTRLIFCGTFVFLGFGALGAIWGYILSGFILSVFGFILIYINHYREYTQSIKIEDDLRRRIGEYAIPITATQLAVGLEHKVDTILVGFFLDPIAVGFYTLSEQITSFIRTPASALGFAVSPTFGAMQSQGSVKKLSRIYEQSIIYSILFYLPAAFGTIILSENIILLIFGEDFKGAIPVLQVFGILIILYAISGPTTNGLDFLGRARQRAIIKTFSALLNIVLNIILIPTIGVVGAAIATVITFSIYVLLSIAIIYNELQLNIAKLIYNLIIILLITLLMTLCVWMLSSYIQNIFSLVGVAIAGFSIWIVAVIVTGLMSIQDIRRTIGI